MTRKWCCFNFTDEKIVLFKMNNLRKYQWCNPICLVDFEFEVKKTDKWELLNLLRF